MVQEKRGGVGGDGDPMLISKNPNQNCASSGEKMRRRRYQKGSLQPRRHGKRRVWVIQYWDSEGHHRYHTIGPMTDYTKSQAQVEQENFMRGINGGQAGENAIRPVLVAEFINQVYLPFFRGKWKDSTKETSENRIQ